MKYGVNRTITEALQNIEDRVPGAFRIRLLSEVLDDPDDRKQAHEIVDKYRADVVIWGNYNVTDAHALVSTKVLTLIDCNCKYLSPFSEYRLESGVPTTKERIDDFRLQKQISEQIAALVLMSVAGQQYEEEHIESAIRIADMALRYPTLDNAVRSDLLIVRGLAAWRANMKDVSLKDFGAAVSAQPTNARAHVGLAVAQYTAGDNVGAVASCSRALKYDPTNGLAYWVRASAYKDMKDFDSATKDFEVLLKLETRSKPPDGSLAYDAREAIEQMQIARRNGPLTATPH